MLVTVLPFVVLAKLIANRVPTLWYGCNRLILCNLESLNPSCWYCKPM